MDKKDIKKVSIDSMERLAKVMNDSPSIVKMADTEFKITALKPGTQWLIAEESCKILKAEKANFTDVIKQFSMNVPSVVSIITLAILNDKNAIYEDYEKKKYSQIYHSIYETIMWETNPDNWIDLFVEIMNSLSLEYFFRTTSAIAMIREMALGRKKTMEEQKS